jgi:hypothetical protein
MTDTERYAKQGLYANADKEYSIAKQYFKRSLMSLRQDPSQIQHIENYANYGRAFSILLGWLKDIDNRIQVAGIAYYCLSKAILVDEQEIFTGYNYGSRLLLMHENADAFAHIIFTVEPIRMVLSQFFYEEMEDVQHKMEIADNQRCEQFFVEFSFISNYKTDLEEKALSGCYGPDATLESIVAEGELLHEKVYKHLEKRIIEENDLEFD